MRKRSLIIILILVIVIGGIVGWFAYVNRAQLGGTGELFGNIFPRSGTAPLAENELSGQDGRDSDREGDARTAARNVPDVRIVYDKPVSGAIAFEQGGEAFFRFVERESGHVFEARADGTEEPRRISNTTLPGIHRALWLDPDTFVLQYLGGRNAIETFRARVTGDGSIQGTFLDPNIAEIAASTDGELLYLTDDDTEARMVRTDQSGENPQTVLRSPLTEWLVEWPEAGTVTLLTKPSFDAPGFFYIVDAETGARTAALRDMTALAARADTRADTILYSERAGEGVRTGIYDRSTNETRDFALTTFPEKCVWSAVQTRALYCAAPQQSLRGEYPDSWYQGIVSFADDIWHVDLETGNLDLLFASSRTNGEVDAINLTLSPNEGYLLFINKKDYSLWSVRLDAGAEDEARE